MRFVLLCFLTFKLVGYEFSICSFFQDEAPYLKEWIEYHQLIGFEHFWLYNNNSQDHYQEVLKPYIDQHIVELIDWPSPPGEFWAAHQVMAFNDGIKRAIPSSTWLALIDIDEFIVPEFGADEFKQRMRDYEKIDDLGGLVLFWQIFGTSDIYEIDPKKTLIESLTRCALASYPMNNIVKSIVKPSAISFFDIHSGAYKAGFHPYSLNGKVVAKEIAFNDPVHSPIRLNHYWVRTLNWFYEKKLPRLRMFNEGQFTPEIIEALNNDLNRQEDLTIFQYLPDLRTRLFLD